MALYLLTYDLNRPGQNYPSLFAHIEQCGNAWHGMQNVWFVESSMSAEKILDRVVAAADTGDKVWVSRITAAAWFGFPADGSKWVQTKAA